MPNPTRMAQAEPKGSSFKNSTQNTGSRRNYGRNRLTEALRIFHGDGPDNVKNSGTRKH